MSHKTEDAIFLLGGALLGAAAMYMLDPEQGDRRRQRVAKAAGNAWDTTQGGLAEGWDRLRDHASDLADHVSSLSDQAGHTAKAGAGYGSDLIDRARDLASRITGRASELKGHVSDYASDASDCDFADAAQSRISDAYGSARDLAGDAVDRGRKYANQSANSWKSWGSKMVDQARDWGSSLSDRASDYVSSWSDASRDAAKNARKAASRSGRRLHKKIDNALGYHEGFGATSVVGTAVGCCAAGVVAMYLLDPQKGRTRRAKLMDQTGAFVRRTGRTMRATGTNMGNHLRGAAHTAARAVRTSASSPLTTEIGQRVRSEIARCCSHPNFVSFNVDEDGTVTISGPINRTEAETLLAAMNQVPGIGHIINRLETREQMTEREVDEYNSEQQPARQM